jgi:glycogen synthase
VQRLHGWKHFKKSNHDQYNAWIRQVLSLEIVELLDRCERDSWRPVRTHAYDWKLALAALKQELAGYRDVENVAIIT